MASTRKDIEDISVPALPIPSQQYNYPVTVQTNNILRLFFNKIVSTVKAITDVEEGAKYLYAPRGLFYSTTQQTAALANTEYHVHFENTYISNGVSIVDDFKITCTHDGVYSFQITILTSHGNASDATITTWLRRNDIDIPYAGQKQTLKGAADRAVYWNFNIDMRAGDFLELYWATDDNSLELHTEAPNGLHPGIPSTIAAVSFVSNIT